MRLRMLPVLGAVACAGPVTQTPPPTPAAEAETDPAPPPRDDGRLPDGVTPRGYRLELTIDPRQETFLGKSSIEVVVERPTRAIVLHGRDLDVRMAGLRRAGAEAVWAKARLREAARSKGTPEELVLVFESEVASGPATLEIEYEAKFTRGLSGVYRVKEKDAFYAFTQFEPNDARRAFPSFDEPAHKVPFDVAISVPQGNLAITNMPEIDRREDPRAELVTFQFAKSPPMPTYLVALGVGPFDVTEGPVGEPPIRLVTVAGKGAMGSLALQAAREQLPVLEKYFGQPYPYPKLDIVAVPNFAAGAMENVGFVTFREELLLLDPKQASQPARRRMAGVMAHELAHMWFGNLVTMNWWDDLWLNEGFATWMAYKTLDQWKPNLRVGIDAVGRATSVMDNDVLASARRIRQPVRSTSEALEAFDGITYVKGMAVLSMVERWLGPEVFQQGVQQYLKAHEWKNAKAEDLFGALGAASKADATSVMESFIGQTGVPLIEAQLDCEGAPSVRLSQREYLPIGREASTAKTWKVPVCVSVPEGKGVNQSCGLVAEAPVSVELGVKRCPPWVFPNAASSGYFRWKVDPKLLAAIVDADLGAEERVGRASNLFALVESGDLGVDAYLDMLPKLMNGEQLRVVWETVIDSLRRIDASLKNESLRPKLQERFRALLVPPLDALGWEPRAGEGARIQLFRQTLLAALGELAPTRKLTELATKRTLQWLEDPLSVSSDLVGGLIATAAHQGDDALVEKLLGRLEEAKFPEHRLLALRGLTGVSGRDRIQRVLGHTVDGTIRMQDLRYVFRPLFSRRDARPIAYEWIEGNFDKLAQKLPSFALGRFARVAASLCDEGRISAAEAFFQPRIAKLEGGEKHLRQAIEAGRLCAAFARHHGPVLESLLQAKP